MKKCMINGKIIEVSDDEFTKQKERRNGRLGRFKDHSKEKKINSDASNYEVRISALEKSVEEILSKLNKNK